MKTKLAAVLVLVAVGAGAVLYATGAIGSSASTTTDYLTSPATVGDVTEQIAATGTVAPTSRTAITFGTSGWDATDTNAVQAAPATYPVREVEVKVGDTVAKGDALATADTADLEAQLRQATNDLKSAQVGLRAARTTLSDAEDADVTAQIRQAKQGLYSADNQLAQAEQKVEDLQDQIKAGTLTAPVAGLVTEVALVAGADAPAGAAVVIDSRDFKVTTDVVESDLADVKLGQQAAVTVSAVGADVVGTVTDISPVAGADTGSGVVSFPVTVTLQAPPATVRSGMSADVTITTASATNVLTVPAAALRGTNGDYRVLTLAADGSTTPVAVQVGLVTNTVAEITSGLTEGTPVVTGTASELRSTTGTTGGFGGGGVVVNGGAFPGGGPRFQRSNGN